MEGLLIAGFSALILTLFLGGKYRRKRSVLDVQIKKINDVEQYCDSRREAAEEIIQEAKRNAEMLNRKINHEITSKIDELELYKAQSMKEVEDRVQEMRVTGQKEVDKYEKRKGILLSEIKDIEDKSKLKTDDYYKEEMRKFELFKTKSIGELEELIKAKKISGQEEIDKFEKMKKSLITEIKDLKDSAKVFEDDALFVNSGVYKRTYTYSKDSQWEQRLGMIIRDQKRMLKNWQDDRYFLLRLETKKGMNSEKALTAAYSTGRINLQKPDYYGDRDALKQGRKYQQKLVNLMLRAFNIDVQLQINACTFRNFEIRKQRIDKTYAAINKLGLDYKVTISSRYLTNRLDELILRYEWLEYKEKVKEEQRRINQQIREEQVAQDRLEKQEKEAQEQEVMYADAIMQAEENLREASEEERLKLEEKLADLQRKLENMIERKEYISQAMRTKAGHVYIISNIGSFGEGMYKIGMTRRLNPMERVDELGDASVPFPFDVHALISTRNAPVLEKALHKHFDKRRVNLENSRKEFFYVSLAEIQQVLLQQKDELGLTASMELTLAAKAEQWRNSQVRKKYLDAHKDTE
ncbi:bacteriophage-like DNA-binding-containing protein [Synechococcus sp. A15-127]|uniref:DUF4041 domain-containing protein n=1 Tax=Synechococcus sp. A15-127 TaxID=1050624 RepID=UPI0016440957|nr:DUF4041 domain-containing protein [Synechococcus sp. A15-127]QNI94557.1 bacteriophage-like DNA-binding-containing protein [Synechococcus sp. A15-127]